LANPIGGGPGGMRQREPEAEQKPFTRMQKWQIALGIINANVLAALLIALTQYLEKGAGIYGISATVLIPLLMGFTAAYTWRELPLTSGRLIFWSLVNTAVGMAMAYFFLHEGTVCLVMASPLLFAMIMISTLIAFNLLKPKTGPLAASLVPLLLGALLFDCLNPVKEHRNAVTTSMKVNAPPHLVFPHTVAFPKIDEPATSVINWAGLPYPVLTTVDSARVGAARKCVFSGNLVIGEKIIELTPDKSMTFAITDTPHWPEFTDHGKLIQGRITVTDNGDGTSTLTGTSWYALHVYPAWYFGPWADGLIHAVHNRVFTHIKEISEREAKGI
jgi:hypothetical protein